MSLSLIIYPRHTELQLSLRLCDPLKERFLAVLLLVCLDDRAERFEYLFNSPDGIPVLPDSSLRQDRLLHQRKIM